MVEAWQMGRYEGGDGRKPNEGRMVKLSLQRNEQKYKAVDGMIG